MLLYYDELRIWLGFGLGLYLKNGDTFGSVLQVRACCVAAVLHVYLKHHRHSSLEFCYAEGTNVSTETTTGVDMH